MKPRGRAGLSLVELLVSLALGATAIAALGSLLLHTTRGHRQARAAAEVQDSLRFAMARIGADVEMAGFFADVHDADTHLPATAEARAAYSGSCTPSWFFDDRLPLDALDNPTPDRVQGRYPCVRGALAARDVLAIKRVEGRCDPRPEPNRYYLQINAAHASIGLGPPTGSGGMCAPAPGSRHAYRYRPAIWHVAMDAGQPALCREILSGTRMARDCLVRGIEDLQLEFGIDASRDGVPDRFISLEGPPGAELRRRVVAVRVHLLARSISSGGCGGARSFRLGNVVRTADSRDTCWDSLASSFVLRNAQARGVARAIPG